MRLFEKFILILSTIALVQCSARDFSGRVIQQGNLLPEKKLVRLHVGMSKDEVATLMGTSLVEPNFNLDRWDYVFTWKKGGSSMKKKTLVLFFNQGRLSKIERIGF